MPWLLAQTARDVLAVNVPVDPASLRPLVPRPLAPDTHGGHGWVTVLAMRMVDVHPRWLPSVPGLSSFDQVAVRAFVLGPGLQDRGVTFLALDVSHALVAAVGRMALGLPYGRAPVSAAPGRVRSARFTATWSPGGPSDLDPWFAEREVLYAERGGRLLRSVVRHPNVEMTTALVDGDVEPALCSVGLAPRGPTLPSACAVLPSHVWLPRKARS